jgi:hypothetical protein
VCGGSREALLKPAALGCLDEATMVTEIRGAFFAVVSAVLVPGRLLANFVIPFSALRVCASLKFVLSHIHNTYSHTHIFSQ